MSAKAREGLIICLRNQAGEQVLRRWAEESEEKAVRTAEVLYHEGIGYEYVGTQDSVITFVRYPRN